MLRPLAGLAFAFAAPAPSRGVFDPSRLAARLDTVLDQRDAGVGIAVRDLIDGRQLLIRPRQRFPLHGIGTLPLAIAALSAVDRGELSLDERLPPAHAQVHDVALAEHLRRAVSAGDLGSSAVLIERLGGLAEVGRRLRDLIGQDVRFDRQSYEWEPSDAPGLRLSATPVALVDLLQAVDAGFLLSPALTTRLLHWLRAAEVGHACLRAGLPPGWVLAHRARLSRHPRSNAIDGDVGLAYGPAGERIAIAVLLPDAALPQLAEARIAAVASAVVASLR